MTPPLDALRVAKIQAYDAAWYKAWSERALARAPADAAEWLAPVCARFQAEIRTLLAWPQVLIHGEFTVHNVLLRRGRIRPVDWESAAVAVGEIDVAAITEGWEATEQADAIRRYTRARWPEGTPHGFDRVLELARLYWSFRWLGDPWIRTDRLTQEGRLHQIREVAGRLETMELDGSDLG